MLYQPNSVVHFARLPRFALRSLPQPVFNFLAKSRIVEFLCGGKLLACFYEAINRSWVPKLTSFGLLGSWAEVLDRISRLREALRVRELAFVEGLYILCTLEEKPQRAIGRSQLRIIEHFMVTLAKDLEAVVPSREVKPMPRVLTYICGREKQSVAVGVSLTN
ncbi:hypothetical protein [Adhaeretor mobilis]|uniref:hypothetical protein n=1 Tax=Adhaeretor mobilis TaxID=1930276 RepID=UPI001C54E174|nr:hypothetical protein [Adhaeretor mobilis]